MTRPTSSAVVSQRSRERKPHPLDAEFAKAGLDRYIVDDFPTQPWGGRALVEKVIGPTALRSKRVWEPAANRKYLARGLADYCGELILSDIFPYVPGYPTFNFLDLHTMMTPELPAFVGGPVDWVITNPPFARAQEFIETALSIAREGVAMLCRTQITETVGRYETIYSAIPYHSWAYSQFVERLPMQEHTMRRDMGTLTAYGWLTIWKRPQTPEFILMRRHIPPCRVGLERADDYRAPEAD